MQMISKSCGLAACAGLVALLAGASAVAMSGAAVAQDTKVFTVARYPVQASAKNAVAAKRRAVSDGQDAALRSLLKRLVPVTLYARLAQLQLPKGDDVITGVQVRSERNSRTDYEAELDFSFSPESVRRILREAGVPYIEEQAPETTVVLVYRAPDMVQGKVPRGYETAAGQKLWQEAWEGQDLTNALTPVRARPLIRQVHGDTVRMALEGRGGADRILAGEYGMPRVVLAVLQPDLSTKKLTLDLAGTDAVGGLRLKRRFRFEANDLAYGMELAAVVALGVIEGRWKFVRSGAAGEANAVARPAAVTRPDAQAISGPVRMIAQFQSMRRWQQMRQVLEATPGVRRVDVNGLSTSEADVTVAYSGTTQSFRDALLTRGMTLQPIRGGFLLR
ncbi:MAG: DUF2066 domain-containing protein [Pseudomonadota bacterium]